MFSIQLYRWYSPGPTVIVDPYPVEIDIEQTINGIGLARVVFSSATVWSAVHNDAVLAISYYPAPAQPVQLFVGFVTERRIIEDTRTFVELIAAGPETILTRRVNAYPENTANITSFNASSNDRRIDEIIQTLIDYNFRSQATTLNGRAGNAAMSWTINTDLNIDNWYPRSECAYQNVFKVIKSLVQERKGRFWGEVSLPVGTTPTVTFRYRSPSSAPPATANEIPITPKSYTVDRVSIKYTNVFRRFVAVGAGSGNNRPAVAAFPTAYGAADADPEEVITYQSTDPTVLQSLAETKTLEPPEYRAIVDIESGSPNFLPGITHPLGSRFTVVAGSVREPVELISYRVSQREKQAPRWQVRVRVL